MKIPGIDGIKGLFEIFVPGLFLFFNINFFFLLSIPNAFNLTFDELLNLNEKIDFLNSGVFWLFLFVISYMLGIVLRTFKPDRPDYISAMLRRIFSRKALKDVSVNERTTSAQSEDHVANGDETLTDPDNSLQKEKTPGFITRLKENLNGEIKRNDHYRTPFTNEFPYIEWLGEVSAQRMHPRIKTFYQETWGKVFNAMTEKDVAEKDNKQFLNLTKVLLYSNSSHISDELHSVESHTRYISGLFYALYFSFILLSIPFIRSGITIEWKSLAGMLIFQSFIGLEIIWIMILFKKEQGYSALLVFICSLSLNIVVIFFLAHIAFAKTNFMSFIVFSIMMIYLVSLLTISWKFRTIRIREVDYIFAASFASPKFWLLTQNEISFEEFYKLWSKEEK